MIPGQQVVRGAGHSVVCRLRILVKGARVQQVQDLRCNARLLQEHLGDGLQGLCALLLVDDVAEGSTGYAAHGCCWGVGGFVDFTIWPWPWSLAFTTNTESQPSASALAILHGLGWRSLLCDLVILVERAEDLLLARPAPEA